MAQYKTLSGLLDFYRGRRVFVTGHTGFKGSWLCRILAGAGAEVTGYALDPPTHPCLYDRAGLAGRIRDVRGDIRSWEQLSAAYREADPEIVFHMAAQPLVRESYRTPRSTYETNVMGTVNLLECMRTAPGGPPRSAVFVTTDKVYENREQARGYREEEPLDGRDPYSNSKSCAELAVHSYRQSFFGSTAVSTARAGNVIGGGDFAADRIVPDCLRAAARRQTIRVRNPGSVRPYQHVLEPLSAYLLLAKLQYEDPTLAGAYNVGPRDADCLTTGALVTLFCRLWGEDAAWESAAEPNAPHEANFLKLDCGKICARLGWEPRWNMETAMEQTVRFSRIWLAGGDLCDEMDREIRAYFEG